MECVAIAIASRYAEREIKDWGADFRDLGEAIVKLQTAAEKAAGPKPGGPNVERDFSGHWCLALEDLSQTAYWKQEVMN